MRVPFVFWPPFCFLILRGVLFLDLTYLFISFFFFFSSRFLHALLMFLVRTLTFFSGGFCCMSDPRARAGGPPASEEQQAPGRMPLRPARGRDSRRGGRYQGREGRDRGGVDEV